MQHEVQTQYAPVLECDMQFFPFTIYILNHLALQLLFKLTQRNLDPFANRYIDLSYFFSNDFFVDVPAKHLQVGKFRHTLEFLKQGIKNPASRCSPLCLSVITQVYK